MNAHTKLALAFLAVAGIGIGLIVAGLWPNYRLAAFIVGGTLTVVGAVLFAAIWRARG